MAKREILESNLEIEQFEVLGVHSQIGISKMAWELDNAMGSSFWLMEKPLEQMHKKEPSAHTCFLFSPEQDDLRIWLLGNAGDPGYLLSAKPRADFFLVFKSEYPLVQSEFWLESVRNLPNVITAYRLEPDRKKKLLWLEWLGSDSQDWKL